MIHPVIVLALSLLIRTGGARDLTFDANLPRWTGVKKSTSKAATVLPVPLLITDSPC
jgi:hypothetical protein